MRIGDVMTVRPVCCLPSDSAQTAAVLMRKHDTGSLPVVEDHASQRLVGIVTDRDLCMTVVADGKIPNTALVKDSMTGQVVAGRPDDDIEKAEALMRDNLIRRIPVIDERNTVQGIVSLADLVQRSETQPADRISQTVKAISKPTPEASKPRAGAPVGK